VSASASAAAPAKINLFLRVLRERPDGYHDLETLFQAIDLADEVTVELGGEEVRLEVQGTDLGPAEENLAYRAAVRLRSEARLAEGLRVVLVKRIPVGAGLGGGSSDAAAVLRCAARLVGIADDDPILGRIAPELGSDVPLFLAGSPFAIGRGRGEILERLEPLPVADLVLVSPPVHVSTPGAYRALAEARRGGGRAAGPRLSGPPRSWREVAAAAHNDFETVIAARHGEVARSLAALREAGAEMAMMSGSGSTSFGLFADRETAVRAAADLAVELAWPCRSVRTLTTLPTPIVR